MKPVRTVVPFSPDGITDILARALAQKLTEACGQQFVVENKPGGAGQVGVEYVAKLPADGYTLGHRRRHFRDRSADVTG